MSTIVLFMTNKSKGELTEQIVLTELMKRGIVCSKPLGDNQPYDLIIELNHMLYKVQIRTGYKLKGGVKISFQSRRINTKGTYSKLLSKEIDFCMAYSYENNKIYVIQKSTLLKYRNCIQLRIEKSKSNIIKNINNAIDFELDNVLF